MNNCLPGAFARSVKRCCGIDSHFHNWASITKCYARIYGLVSEIDIVNYCWVAAVANWFALHSAKRQLMVICSTLWLCTEQLTFRLWIERALAPVIWNYLCSAWSRHCAKSIAENKKLCAQSSETQPRAPSQPHNNQPLLIKIEITISTPKIPQRMRLTFHPMSRFHKQ